MTSFVSRFQRPTVVRSAPARPAVYAVDSYTDPYPAVVAPVVLASAVITPVALVSVALTPSSRVAPKCPSRYPTVRATQPDDAHRAQRFGGPRHSYTPVGSQLPVSHTRDAPRATEPQDEPLSQRHTPPQLRKAAYRSQFIHTDRIFSTKITNLIVLRTLRAKNGSDFGGSGRNAVPQPPDSPALHPRRNRR